MKRLDLVWMIWRDALGHSAPWLSLDETENGLKGGIDIMETIGYFIYQDKRYVSLAQSIQYDENLEPVKIGGLFSIPVGCIVKMRRLSEPAGRKSRY